MEAFSEVHKNGFGGPVGAKALHGLYSTENERREIRVASVDSFLSFPINGSEKMNQ